MKRSSIWVSSSGDVLRQSCQALSKTVLPEVVACVRDCSDDDMLLLVTDDGRVLQHPVSELKMDRRRSIRILKNRPGTACIDALLMPSHNDWDNSEALPYLCCLTTTGRLSLISQQQIPILSYPSYGVRLQKGHHDLLLQASIAPHDVIEKGGTLFGIPFGPGQLSRYERPINRAGKFVDRMPRKVIRRGFFTGLSG